MKDKKQGTGHTVLTLSILVVLGIFLVSAGLLCRSLYEYRKGRRSTGCSSGMQPKHLAGNLNPGPRTACLRGSRNPCWLLILRPLKS